MWTDPASSKGGSPTAAMNQNLTSTSKALGLQEEEAA